jgi:hypothetical protein
VRITLLLLFSLILPPTPVIPIEQLSSNEYYSINLHQIYQNG